MMTTQKKEVINVDVDLINELRLSGKHYEASRLIRKFQEIGKKNTKIGRRKIHSLTQKTIRFQRRRNDLCVSCGKQPPTIKEGKKLLRCQDCLTKKDERSKKY